MYIEQVQTDNYPIDKMPPQAIAVEKTVLASALIDEEACDSALEGLEVESFYSVANGFIFDAIKKLKARTAPVDIVTVKEELTSMEKLESIGGEAYLSELTESIATSANIMHYVKILQDKATLRKLIREAAKITTDCFKPDADAKEVVDTAEAKIFGIAEENIKDHPEPLKDVLSTTFEMLEKMSKGEGPTGTPSGFTDLDKLTTGFHGGELIIVAARPGMGKTSLALSMALNAAVIPEEKLPVAIFSLEMPKAQLAMRLLCAQAKIDMHRLRGGRLSKNEMARLGQAAGPLGSAPVFIDDTPGLNVMELRAKCRRIKQKEGKLGLVMVDYLQLMKGHEKTQSREQEISSISRSLKELAKELDVPIISLSQLSRAVEQRTGEKRPQLSDLRESGAIEQDADMVLFIYRPDMYTKDDESVKGIAELIIGKQRNGPTDTVKVSFVREFAHFSNLDMTHAEEEEMF